MAIIKVSGKALFNKLRTVSRIVKARSTELNVAYSSFLFEIQGGKLRVTGCDDGGQISTEIDCEIIGTEDMSFLLDSITVMNALKEIPDQPIEIKVEKVAKEKELVYNVKIQYINGKFTMSASDSSIYPIMKELKDAKKITLNSSALKKGLSLYKFAAIDELRPIMMTINLSCINNTLAFAGTDGHALGIYEEEFNEGGEDFSVNIPARISKIITDIMHSEDDIAIEYDDRAIVLTVGEFTIRYRLFEGRYPNFRSVVPNSFKMDVKVDRNDLIAAINRVSVFSQSDVLLIKFQIIGNNLILTSQDIDYQRSAKEDLFLDAVYDDFEVGFKSNLMLDILKNIETDNCIIKLTEPSRAALVVPEGELNSTYLIMPMIIND